MSKNIILSSIAAAMLLATPAFADGDAAAGATVFVKCKACHENEQGVNKIGPTLKGVVGRKGASVEGYNYSDGAKAKSAEGLVWTEETLAAYLPDPKAYVPGTKMAFPGITSKGDIRNVVAYLDSLK